MRFLLFNIAVIAALAYLFLSERGDLQTLMAALEPQAGTVMETEENVPGGENIFGEIIGAAEVGKDSIENQEQPDEAPSQVPGSEDWALLLEELETETKAEEEVTTNAQSDAEDRPEALPSKEQPAASSPESSSENQRLAAGLLPVTDPAVLKRRAEVLDGIVLTEEESPTPEPAPRKAPKIQLAAGESLMSDQERMKQLQGLAEDMEMLFVESLAR